jgi:hypothetical protein
LFHCWEKWFFFHIVVKHHEDEFIFRDFDHQSFSFKWNEHHIQNQQKVLHWIAYSLLKIKFRQISTWGVPQTLRLSDLFHDKLDCSAILSSKSFFIIKPSWEFWIKYFGNAKVILNIRIWYCITHILKTMSLLPIIVFWNFFIENSIWKFCKQHFYS